MNRRTSHFLLPAGCKAVRSEGWSRQDSCSRRWDVVSGKWVPEVLDQLLNEQKRYSELQQRIQGVSTSVLTRTLPRMERDGLITRTVHPAVPPQVEYELTQLGESLDEALTALAAWAELHIDEVSAARRRHLEQDE